MATGLTLRAGTSGELARYVAGQLDRFFADAGLAADEERARSCVEPALERLRPILAAVRNFEPDRFDHFHALQYATFLYLLARQSALGGAGHTFADRLFCLNRALNAIDLYHAVRMPEVFFISHGLGSVLGNADYGDRLVVFQGVTVGRVGEQRPSVGCDVVLYPGASITGCAVVGDRCVIGAGVQLHGESIPSDSVVSLRAGTLSIAPRKRDYAALYFRHSLC